MDGETASRRRDRLDHNAGRRLRRRNIEGRELLPVLNEVDVFRDPMANLLSATRLLDGFDSTPEIKTALTRLEATAVQLDKLGSAEPGPSASSSRRAPSSAPRQQASSHYGSSDQGRRRQGGHQYGGHQQGGQGGKGGRPTQTNHFPRAEPPIIDARHRITQLRTERTRAAECSTDSIPELIDDYGDTCPAYTHDIRSRSFPAKFKPSGIMIYDGKLDPSVWLMRYSSSIQAVGGDDYTKMLYFPVVMDQAPLVWLKSLAPNSISSWHALKRAFVTNFQGSCKKPGSKYELAVVKQKPDETLREFNKRFWDVNANCKPIPDSDVIDAFQNGMYDPSHFRSLGWNRSTIVDELAAILDRWMDTDDQEPIRYRKHSDNPERKLQQGNRQDSFNRNNNNNNSRKRSAETTVAMLDGLQRAQNAEQRKEEFQKLLNKRCPIHPKNKHSTLR